jgi:delta-aminolevulinic acid dehydratase/porphobilinogen synthase
LGVPRLSKKYTSNLYYPYRASAGTIKTMVDKEKIYNKIIHMKRYLRLQHTSHELGRAWKTEVS